LEAAIRRVIDGAGGDTSDQTPAGKYATTGRALEIAARNGDIVVIGSLIITVVDAAYNDPSSLAAEAETLAAIALQFVKDAGELVTSFF
jgi:hypothetical protein